MSKGKNWYIEKLRHPKWQKKRLQILDRDGFKCTECGDTEATLNVHHLSYDYGKDPWDYPDENMKTLCENCHEYLHSLEKVRDLKEGEANVVLFTAFENMIRTFAGNHDKVNQIGLWEAFYQVEKAVRFINIPPQLIHIQVSNELQYQFKLFRLEVNTYEAEDEDRCVVYSFVKMIEGENE